MARQSNARAAASILKLDFITLDVMRNGRGAAQGESGKGRQQGPAN